MSGSYLLDTNAIINALNLALKLPRGNYSISIITEMELLSFPKLQENEKKQIEKLLQYFVIYNISEQIKNKTIEIRKNYNIKLPDSIIVATALVNNLTLITNDKGLFKIKELKILTLQELL